MNKKIVIGIVLLLLIGGAAVFFGGGTDLFQGNQFAKNFQKKSANTSSKSTKQVADCSALRSEYEACLNSDRAKTKGDGCQNERDALTRNGCPVPSARMGAVQNVSVVEPFDGPLNCETPQVILETPGQSIIAMKLVDNFVYYVTGSAPYEMYRKDIRYSVRAELIYTSSSDESFDQTFGIKSRGNNLLFTDNSGYKVYSGSWGSVSLYPRQEISFLGLHFLDDHNIFTARLVEDPSRRELEIVIDDLSTRVRWDNTFSVHFDVPISRPQFRIIGADNGNYLFAYAHDDGFGPYVYLYGADGLRRFPPLVVENRLSLRKTFKFPYVLYEAIDDFGLLNVVTGIDTSLNISSRGRGRLPEFFDFARNYVVLKPINDRRLIRVIASDSANNSDFYRAFNEHLSIIGLSGHDNGLAWVESGAGPETIYYCAY